MAHALPHAYLARAVATTTAVLWLLQWVSSGGVDLVEAFAIALWVSAVLSALTLVAGRIDLERTPIWRQLVTLALTAGFTSSAVNLVLWGVIAVFPGLTDAGPQQRLWATAVVGFFDGDALFGFWALLVELPRRIGVERRFEQERHALRQEAELARIRAALEPHFVLNTLNTIAGLVADDPKEARSMIVTLGDLLRDAMHGVQRHQHSVREEVHWLRGFARILEARHFGRLVFEWDVDNNALDCSLPVLLLQPILENAVQHGALRGTQSGRVVVRIVCDRSHLRCHVADDGPGFAQATVRPEGRGLALVRRRIALEAPDALMTIQSKPGATNVEIRLPRRIV